MLIQCPLCGILASKENFRLLGNHKVICGSCKTIMDIGFLCPECGQIMYCGDPIYENLSVRLLIRSYLVNKRFPVMKGEKSCELCGHKAIANDFKIAIGIRTKFTIIQQND
jgi:hypothetical protein